MEWIFLAAGIVGGGATIWLFVRGRETALRAEVRGHLSEIARLEQQVEHEREIAHEKERLAEEVKSRLAETIEAAASRAFKGNNEEFLSLAGQRLAPIDERLHSFEQQLRELERAREGAYGSLTQQVQGLLEAQELLRGETGKLVSALTKPGVRGRWGEMTMRRVVELAGLVEHCDFAEQETLEGADGRQRPDLVVKLPGGGSVAVDAKAPLDAYLAAADASEESVRRQRLDEHARSLRDHMVALGRKGYWDRLDSAPDFVVMFVPGESFVAAAVERRPALFEEGFANKVILATPSTLVALLRVVAFGWRQETIAESAQQVSELGRELHKRVASMAGHYATLGRRLDSAVDSYNKTVGALESRVLPQARRFEELGAHSKDEIADLDPVDKRSRGLTAPELNDDDDRRVVELDRGQARHDDADDHADGFGNAAAEGR